MGSHYMGELSQEEIVQPDWYRHIRAAPLLGMSVTELLALPPFDYEYWVERALAAQRAEQDAQELVRFATQREGTT